MKKSSNLKNRRLYHYTKTLDTLSRILEEGFWPQYSLEDFSWIQEDSPLYLAFPCVCFTEIELERSEAHRKDYGDYAIGFDKKWEARRLMRPLKYIAGQDSSFLTPQHRRALATYGELDKSSGLIHFRPAELNPQYFGDVWQTLPYIKENAGFTLQRRPKPRHDMTHVWLLKRLKDEDEWRYVPEKHRNRLFSVLTMVAPP